MKDDILDDLNETNYSNKKWYARVGFVVIGTIILYFIIEYFRSKLPQNLYEDEQTQISTMGLAIMIILVINSLLIPSLLNRIYPKISLLKTVIYSGVLLIVIELSFKVAQAILIQNTLSSISVVNYLKPAFMLGVIGTAIANVKAHKLAQKKITFPFLFLIIIWMGISYIAKVTN